MDSVHVIGIDPGLVDTGLVALSLSREKRTVTVQHAVVEGYDVDKIEELVRARPRSRVFAEKYRPRKHLSSDERMVKGEALLKSRLVQSMHLPLHLLNNTGVSTTVKPGVLQLLGLWKFSTATHHQDLRSAARIAVLGMLKDNDTNRLLSDVVRDAINGRPWRVKLSNSARLYPAEPSP